MTVPIKLANARLAACRKWPYSSHAVLSLIPVCRPGLGTMAVDKKWRLYYDPAFIEATPPDELIGVILHEVSHLLLKHHKRAQGIVPDNDYERWNWAADFAINSILKGENIKLTDGALFPDKFKLPFGKTAEEYYRMLLEKSEAEKEKEKSQENPDKPDSPNDEPSEPGEEPGGDGGSGGGGIGGDEPSDGEGSSNTPGKPGEESHGKGGNTNEIPEGAKPKPGESGSCSDGKDRPWENTEEQEEEGVDETDTPPGYDPHEIDQILRKTAEAMQRGNAPGCFKRAAEEILNPKVDPRRLLMRALQRHTSTLMNGGGKYSYRRPARRPSLGGTIRPRAFQPVPKITVIVDTSGSMNDRDLGLCVGFVAKVLSGLRLRDGVHVIVGDAAVQGDMQCLDAKKLKLSGGGGTDMARLIEHAASLKDKPGLIIVCTDGFTGWPDRSVGVPVVACITRDESIYYKVPSWIEKVVMG